MSRLFQRKLLSIIVFLFSFLSLSHFLNAKDENKEVLFRQNGKVSWFIKSDYYSFAALLKMDEGYKKIESDFDGEMSLALICDARGRTVSIIYTKENSNSPKAEFSKSNIIFINNKTAGEISVEENENILYINDKNEDFYFENLLNAILRDGNVLLIKVDGKFRFKKVRLYIDTSPRNDIELDRIRSECKVRK
jgi:hypothetical protein